MIYVLKSISFYNLKARAAGLNEEATDKFVLDGFFATLTNTNFYKKGVSTLALLALLSLSVKNITPGPTLPACLSPNVLKVLIEKFNIKPHTTVEEDMKVLLPQA